jgi:hypothetical protein
MEKVDAPNGVQTDVNTSGDVADDSGLDPKQLKATNERLLSESKKNREAAQKTKQELEAQLREQGKWKELAEGYKTKLAETEKRVMTDKINSTLSLLAEKAGFQGKKEKLLNLVDVSQIVYDEQTGNVYGADQAIDLLKSELPQLFQQPKTPTLNPVVPNGVIKQQPVNVKDLSKLTQEKKTELWNVAMQSAKLK